MAFVEVNKNAFRHNFGTAGIDDPLISVGIEKANVAHIYIRLPRELVHATWSDKLINGGRTVRLKLLEGTETDAGSLMLVHNPMGYTFTCSAYAKKSGAPSTASFVTKFGIKALKFYVPNTAPIDPTVFEYSIDGQNMLILAPQWLVYTPKQPVRSTMVPVEKVQPGRPHVTSNAEQRRLLRR